MRQMFGGIETTHVLLPLAAGPMRQSALLHSGPHHLEEAIEILSQSNLIVRIRKSPGRVLWQLNRDVPWYAELLILLRRMLETIGEL